MKNFDFVWKLVFSSHQWGKKPPSIESLQCFRHYDNAKNTKMRQGSNTKVSVETREIINEENSIYVRKTRSDLVYGKPKYKSGCCLAIATCCYVGTWAQCF